MLTNDDLKRMRKNAEKYMVSPENSIPFGEVTAEECELAEDVLDLLIELDRVRKIHTQEQRRSADRLRAALEQNDVARMVDEGNPNV